MPPPVSMPLRVYLPLFTPTPCGTFRTLLWISVPVPTVTPPVKVALFPARVSVWVPVAMSRMPLPDSGPLSSSEVPPMLNTQFGVPELSTLVSTTGPMMVLAPLLLFSVAPSFTTMILLI